VNESVSSAITTTSVAAFATVPATCTSFTPSANWHRG